MTERLYLSDPYLSTFKARIIERRHLRPEARLVVVLDRTAFSPAAAGVASDRGTLGDSQVIDVLEDKQGRLLHILSQDPWRDDVEGQVDWTRRFGLMQHHTAQHILSEALAQVSGAQTVAVSVTPQVAWVEIDKMLSEPDFERVEAWANQLIATGRPARVATVDAARVGSLPGLAPGQEVIGQTARVFSIEGMRLYICSAAHVARTSEIGLLRIERVVQPRDRPRVEFKCGIRLLEDFRHLDQLVGRLASSLGVPLTELEQAVTTLKTHAGQAVEVITAMHDKMLEYEGMALEARGGQVGKIRVIKHVFPESRDVTELRDLVRKMAEQPDRVILIGTAGARAQLFFTCSADVNQDMNVLMRAATQVLGTQGGGQAKKWAESLPVQADAARVEVALSKAGALVKARR